MKETIKDYTGKIIGSVETLPNGDKTVRDFYGKILGHYRKSTDETVDFYGRKLYKGDMAVALLTK